MNNLAPFPYFVGAQSLHELANRRSRVCVMNILGTESAQVTPISHSFSGGNVVAGVQYGSAGEVLETPRGPIPVYGSVAELLENGHDFDTGVIYLPPAAVSHAVSELCVHNPFLKRIFIVSEKVSVRDSRMIRYVAQNRQVDVFGANSLGIANSWDQVRIGGALGGDNPAACLKRGCIAIYSNSGNFCTTVAEYLKTAGFGTSTILSSGKDLYIHFALAEFLYCAENDPRTKAVVLYIEPGGYYEKQALDWIKENRLPFSKPLIACVTGRWKSRLARPCGHAGAVAGGNDDAFAKEQWFDEFFGVPPFSAENPEVGPYGVRVTTIEDIPAAVAMVMKQLGEEPDFDPEGDLSLKPWLVNQQGLELPENLSLTPVRPVSPYDQQLAKANKQIGACLVRESMRNASSATRVDLVTQQTEIHGRAVLDLVENPFAGNCLFALLRGEIPAEAIPVANLILNWMTQKAAARPLPLAPMGRADGASPNAYLAAELLLAGNSHWIRDLSAVSERLVDIFAEHIARDLDPDDDFIQRVLKSVRYLPKSKVTDDDRIFAKACANLVKKLGQETTLTQFAIRYSAREQNRKEKSNPMHLLVAGILLGWAWPSLKNRRIPRQTAVEMAHHLAMIGLVTSSGAIAPALLDKGEADLGQDFVQSIFRSLFGRSGSNTELFSLNALLNLTISNGPGTLSVMGAKESVSAGNTIATAYAGFMTNTGYAHGGNGFRAIAYLLEVFSDQDPFSVTGKKRDKLLRALAEKSARKFLDLKQKRRGVGRLEPIPCINHPVFRGKPVNIDPREEYLRRLLLEKGICNPFLEFYHHLVVELHAIGATRNVFCVNVDAVIACLALELFWQQFKSGDIGIQEMQDSVFRLFLYGRMPGVAAEIADHRSRGTDMDCRTPNVELRYLK